MARKRKTGRDAFAEWVREKGGSVLAAEALTCGDSMVRHICRGSRPLSPEIAWAVDKDSRGQVTREQLIPELFGPIKYNRR